MKQTLIIFVFSLFVLNVTANNRPIKTKDCIEQSINKDKIKNTTITTHHFLECMDKDTYFPSFLVDKCKNILLNFCREIERKDVKSLNALYSLSHVAVKELNALQNEFFEHGSEIETAARECLAMDFHFIAKTYGFNQVDVEELIAPREW